jgi:hypothetical protein
MLTVKADGTRNSQVTQRVKDAIYNWFEYKGVWQIRQATVLHHYRGGEYVCMSKQMPMSSSDMASFNRAAGEAVSYWRNKSIKDGVIWLHREWIADLDTLRSVED